MNTNDRINNIIQQFLDSKGNYDYLKPICIAHEDYVTARGVKFDPHPDYSHKKGYLVKDDLLDDAVRIKRLTILNSDIEKYNEWAGDNIRYPHLDLYHPYSFLVVRENTGQEKQYKDLWVGGKLYVEIVDEELYKLKEDEDFIPRFNRTIYEYLISKKESAQAEDRWDEENIWYTPYRNFGDWFDKQPKYGDAESYFEEIADCDIGVSIDGEHRNAVQMVKKLTKQNKALKIHRHKPNRVEMQETIDKNRFKNDKCNNTKVGSDLGVDPETAKRWIEKLGLFDYAYNPHHLK